MIDQWGKGAKYWDKPWNPVIGCVPVSEGCEHCYAKRTVERFGMNGGDFAPCYKTSKPPRKGVVFVGNMTDLFGSWNSRELIRHWLAQLPRTAVNLVLTKRAARMAETVYPGAELPHIWWGVTAENQARADERIPHLLSLKKMDWTSQHLKVNRWLSLEPLLGPIKLNDYLAMNRYYPVICKHCGWAGSSEACPGGDDYYTCPKCFTGEPEETEQLIEGVIVGAESGPNLRECKIEWIESIVEQCQNAGVRVFVKQIHLNGKLVKDINQFPAHLQIRQVPWR